MNIQEIHIEDINENFFTLCAKRWLLITAGNKEKFNPMTASWGGFGHLWNKPVIFLFIRPTRYTYQLMEKNENCSISILKDEYRSILNFCGSKSGFDVDKVKETGLNPFFKDPFIFYKEAELMLGCTKLYHHDLDPENFYSADIESFYPKKDYHRMYICEIKMILRSSN
jgi:flavin reductase (DIM6/NTAB) family NADH-FMN oxidoreductase RutF